MDIQTLSTEKVKIEFWAQCKKSVGKFVSLFSMETKDINLGSLILPCEVFSHFEIVDFIDSEKEIQLFLDEKFVPPATNGYSSKGFTEQSVIQDFPLRGKAVFLHISRRKWLNNSTMEVVTNEYDLTHLGTQITAEFADFLKGIHRKLCN